MGNVPPREASLSHPTLEAVLLPGKASLTRLAHPGAVSPPPH